MAKLDELYVLNVSERFNNYVNQVIEKPQNYPVYVVKAVKRHIEDAKKSWNYIFEWSEGVKPVYFLEQLRMTKEYSGMPLKLEDWQVFFVVSVYAWVDKKTRQRRFNRVMLAVPKKNGKSAVAAGLGIYHLLTDTGAEVVLAAQAQKQAREVFEAVQTYISQSDDLKQYLSPEFYSIKYKAKKGKLVAISSEVKTIHGVNPSTIILDEWFETTHPALYNTLTASAATRKSYITYLIGSHTSNINGYGKKVEDEIKLVLDGIIEDNETFALIYEPSPTDRLEEEETWIKVNPNWNVCIQPKNVREDWKRKKSTSITRNDFYNYVLNVWTSSKEGWITDEKIDTVRVPVSFEDIRGSNITIGFDLSQVWDLTAFAFVAEYEGKPTLLFRAYIPEETLETRTKLENPFFLDWIEKGFVKVVKGAVIKTDFLYQDIMDLVKTYQLGISSITFDSARAGDLVSAFEDNGILCLGIRNSIYGMNQPTVMFQSAMIDSQIYIEDNPVFWWCLSNTEIENRNGMIMPTKPDANKDRKRIDLVVAGIMALYRYNVSKNLIQTDSLGDFINLPNDFFLIR